MADPVTPLILDDVELLELIFYTISDFTITSTSSVVQEYLITVDEINLYPSGSSPSPDPPPDTCPESRPNQGMLYPRG